MESSPKTLCAYLDGTTGYQCTLSICKVKGFPSKARTARGDLETPKGKIPNTLFYICLAAESFLQHKLFDQVINEQRQCSHYDSEKRIKIPKKYRLKK